MLASMVSKLAATSTASPELGDNLQVPMATSLSGAGAQ